MQYFSQYGQDEYLDKYIFKKKEKGVFLDIGAYDGKRLSNTYFFEKVRGWEGICFEPNPRVYKELLKNRSCRCINSAISDKEGDFDFLDLEGVETLGGLIEKYDSRHLERVEVDYVRYSGVSKNVIKVKCLNLNKVLQNANLEIVDYCSIDTEGGELDILKSIDFNKLKIKVLTVENNFPIKNKIFKFLENFRASTIEGYLRKQGYKKIAVLGSDEIYLLKDY